MRESSSIHGSQRLPWFTVVSTLFCCLVYGLSMPETESLAYDRALIFQNEPWRLLTAHFVHLNFQHLAWNVGSYAVMSYMFERDLGVSPARQIGVILFSAIVVDALLLVDASLSGYAGLSGVLNGMLAVMLWESWRQTKSRSVWLVTILSVGKIAYEAATGNTLFVDVPWPAAAEGHAGGFFAGIVFVTLRFFWLSWRQTPCKFITKTMA